MSGRRRAPARMAFALSPALESRAEEIIAEARAGDRDEAWVERLSELIVELTREGLHFYFLHPLELADAGLGVRTIARLGVGSAEKGLPLMVRRAVAAMTDPQRIAIVDFLDDALIRSRPAR